VERIRNNEGFFDAKSGGLRGAGGLAPPLLLQKNVCIDTKAIKS